MNRPFLVKALRIVTHCAVALAMQQAKGADVVLGDVTAGSGVNIHFTDPRPGELEMLKAGGFKWVRMDFMWQSTEREKGVYDFSAYDHLLEALTPEGIRAYFILDYSNSLYEPQASVRSQAGREAYTKWALAAVEHFKGHGIIWEIWNEPNGGFWPPQANAAEFVEMAAPASKAIHDAYPQETLVGPATSTIDMDFLEACFKAGLLDSWNGGVSVHPYRQSGPENVEAEYGALRSLIEKYTDGRGAPILSGEWGYSSAWDHFDPDQQGKMLPREWLMNAVNLAPVSIWYDWHDDGTDPKEGEHHFGTVENAYHAGRNPVYDPKPAYLAAKTYNTVLKGCKFWKRISLGSMEHRGMLLAGEGGKMVLAAWTTAPGESTVRVPSDNGEFASIGHLGEIQPKISAKNGVLEFKVSGAMRYIVFEHWNEKLNAALDAFVMPLTVAPATGTEVRVQVENFAGRPFKAKVELTGAEGVSTAETQQQVTLSADSATQSTVFHLNKAPMGNYRLGAKVEANGATIAEILPRTFLPADTALLNDAHVSGEGSPEVGGTFAISAAEAPEKLPGGGAGATRLDYEFQDGWKFAAVHPGAGGKEIAGSTTATRVTFGMWIYGNRSHLSPRLRVMDAGGRVWQPGMPGIGWQGWKYVECVVDADTAHWGGSEPDSHRAPAFPLKWDTAFLLDNPQRKPSKGTLYFTAPAVILE